MIRKFYDYSGGNPFELGTSAKTVAASTAASIDSGNRQPQSDLQKEIEDYCQREILFNSRISMYEEQLKEAQENATLFEINMNVWKDAYNEQLEELKKAKEEIEIFKLISKNAGEKNKQLDHENERLKAALTQSVELIKQWKGKAIASSGKSKEIIEEIWLEYYDNAPEMKLIREELKEQ